MSGRVHTHDMGYLREFGLRLVEDRPVPTWLLHAADGTNHELEPSPPVARLDAHALRRPAPAGGRRLLVGETATDSVVQQALAGRVHILTSTPPRLIHDGHLYAPLGGPEAPQPRPHPGRMTWTRWTVERYLLLATAPARQSAIADLSQVRQQSVSTTARHLGELVADAGAGLATINRPGLLAHWHAEYPGPRGARLGWYGLDPVVEQTRRAVEAAEIAGSRALVSGDVAADMLAPWKLPARGLVYLDRPVDLEIDGFVPAPLEEATLVTCVPLDPSLWRLTSLRARSPMPDSVQLADPAIVYRDLMASGEVDSAEAAEHLATHALLDLA